MKSIILAALLPLLIAAAPAPLPPCDLAPPAPPASSAPPPTSDAVAPPAPTGGPPTSPPPEGPPAPPSTEEPPAPPPSDGGAPAPGPHPLEAIILGLAPDSATCDGAAFPEECRTAAQAAPLVAASWDRYKLDNANERAGTLALMLLESGNFKFARNHFPKPGRPGQGTRNMQMYDYNVEYADALFNTDGNNQTVIQAKADGDKNKVLELVNTDEHSFGSAAWFLTAKCTDDVRGAVKGGPEGDLKGWQMWMGDCVDTENTAERDAGFTAAQTALKDYKP